MSNEMAAAYQAATMGPARSMGSVEETSEEEAAESAAGMGPPATATTVDSGHHHHQASSHQRRHLHGRRSSDNNSVLSDVNSSLGSDDLRSNSLLPVPGAATRIKPSKHSIVGGSPPPDVSLVNHAVHSADQHHHKPPYVSFSLSFQMRLVLMFPSSHSPQNFSSERPRSRPCQSCPFDQCRCRPALFV